MLDKCPQCQKKLAPPFHSSNRQVCTGCGWSDRPSNKNVSRINRTVNKITSLIKLNLLEKIIAGVVIITGLTVLGFNFYISEDDRLDVRGLELEILDAYPPGPRPLANYLIDETSFKSKKILSGMSLEVFDAIHSKASNIASGYCLYSHEGYTSIEAKNKTVDYVKKVLDKEKELYQPEEYRAVKEFYYSGVDAGVAICD